MHYQSVHPQIHVQIKSQKYSLRQSFNQNKMGPETAYNRVFPVSEMHIVKQVPEYISQAQSRGRQTNFWEKKQVESEGFNCFDNGRKVLEMNRITQISYQQNFRTPSTTNSAEYHAFQQLQSHRNSSKPTGQVKFSLKNVKKDTETKMGSRNVYNGGRIRHEQRQLTEHFPTPICTDERPTEELNSQAGSSIKYSLKNGRRKHPKPEVFLSLKYQDLINLVRCKSSSNFFPQNNQNNLPANKKMFCNIGRSNENGCRCQPKCLWMNRWLSCIGQLQLQQPVRKRDEKQWQAIVKQIQRDLPRTQPDHPAFRQSKMIEMLKDVLLGYAELDHEVGYVQGMNFVAAALVYHSHNSYDALKVFNYLMKACGYRRLFLGDLSFGRFIAGRLVQEMRRLVHDLFMHLSEEGIDLELFASSWYFSLCGSFVPLEAMHHFIDKFIKKNFSGVNQLLLTLILHNKENLMKQTDSHLMLEFSNQSLYQYGEGVDWQDLRDRSDRILLSPIEH